MFLTAGSNFPLPRLVYKRRMCANQPRQALQLDLPTLEIRMAPHTHTRLKVLNEVCSTIKLNPLTVP